MSVKELGLDWDRRASAWRARSACGARQAPGAFGADGKSDPRATLSSQSTEDSDLRPPARATVTVLVHHDARPCRASGPLCALSDSSRAKFGSVQIAIKATHAPIRAPALKQTMRHFGLGIHSPGIFARIRDCDQPWRETDLPLKCPSFHRKAENRLFRRPRERGKLNFK